MAIGYYNFGNIEQGNQYAANQLAGLGQQIGQAIQTHAATQSAQAMLPVIQSQYAQGMQKIASGDSTGIADVTQAAGLAGQNPLTAHYSNQMIAGATQANENYRNKLITDTRLQTAGLGYIGKMAGIQAAHPVDEQGNPISKAPTQYQQSEMDLKNAQLKAKQVGLYSNLWNGQAAQGNNPGSAGASEAYDNITKALQDGGSPTKEDLRKFAGAYSQYKQTQNALGNAGIQDANFENAYKEIEGHLMNAQKTVNDKIKGLPAGSDPQHAGGHNLGFLGIWGGENLKQQQDNINQAVQNFSALKGAGKPQGSAGGLPSATGGAAQNPSTQAIMQAVQAAKLHPDKVDLIKSRLQGAGIDPSMLDQAIQSQQAQQQSAPQASMIPAASSVASTEEENTSPEPETE